MTGKIFKTLFVCLFAYMAVIVLMVYAQRDLQYVPSSVNPSPSTTVAPEMVETAINTADGYTHESWVYLGHENAPVVVLMHGNAWNAGKRANKARVLIDAGYNVVIVGYRGYGGNPGTPSEDGLVTDAAADIKWLQAAHKIPFRDMVLYGESIGTGVAVKIATLYPDAAGLVLEVPFDSALAVARDRYPFIIGLDRLMHDTYRSDLRMPSITMPKLVLVAGNDHTIPPAHARALFAVAAEPKKIAEFPGAGHNDLYDLPAGQNAQSAILPFLSNVFKQGH